MARRRPEPIPHAVEPEWRHRWLCRAPFLVYGAATVSHDALVDVLRAAIERIEDGRGSLAQRTAAIEAVLAEHDVLDLVERRMAVLLRARLRGGRAEETLVACDLLAESRLPPGRRTL